MTSQTDFFAEGTAESNAQFRLTRCQYHNWGTLPDYHDIHVATRGYLIVGQSGTGKSTMMDANATLLTRPRNLGFNVAANTSSNPKDDRNLMSYVRGAFRTITSDSGSPVSDYMRADTTWSGLAQTYRNANGQVVTIAQVFWVRGRTADRKELKRVFMVIDREFDMTEVEAFASDDFNVKKLRALPGVSLYDDYTGYCDRFSRLMGIESENALQLLYKTQSAKNLGELDEFLRNYALDQPQAPELAEKIVEHFKDLRGAHASVVEIRQQLNVLSKVPELHESFKDNQKHAEQLLNLKNSLGVYQDKVHDRLFEEAIATAGLELETSNARAKEFRSQEQAAHDHYSILLRKRSGAASGEIDTCRHQVKQAGLHLDAVRKNLPILDAVAELCVLPSPESDEAFYALRAAARKYLTEYKERAERIRNDRDRLKIEQSVVTNQLRSVQSELAALSKRKSNIPSRLQDIRSNICEALGIPESDIPFAGELVDVHEQHQEWKPAAERVLRNFAEHLVVPEELYHLVSNHVNRTHMGGLVKFFSATNALKAGSPSSSSLFNKLTFSDSPLASWVRAKASTQFDLECVNTADDLKLLRRGVTISGLVKSDELSFRKDDRSKIDDRRNWILGGNTKDKIDELLKAAAGLDAECTALEAAIRKLELAQVGVKSLTQCEMLKDMEWDQFDIQSAQAKLERMEDQLEVALEAMPELEELDRQIKEASQAHRSIQNQASTEEAQSRLKEVEIKALENQRKAINPEHLAAQLDNDSLSEIKARFEAEDSLSLDNIERTAAKIKEKLYREERSVLTKLNELESSLVGLFKDFKREWPIRGAELTDTVESAEGFVEIFKTLSEDGLPQHEERFQQRLREQSSLELSRLNSKISDEHKDIKTRLADVNESLAIAPFGEETHLVIKQRDRQIPEVMAFRQDLREIVSGAMAEHTQEEAEERFHKINKVVQKLESNDPVHRRWRELCLDVRQQVEFTVQEVYTATGAEKELYRSTAGKSGGQGQKLTSTILAAALRYQLAGRDAQLPKFATVFMDEAFGNADEEFAAISVNVFKTFGFQIVVATPGKQVMALEPFIGGATYVSMSARYGTELTPIKYLEDAKCLDFGEVGLERADVLASE